MEVWWSGRQVKLALVVLLVIISNQKQIQNLRLQDELTCLFPALAAENKMA